MKLTYFPSTVLQNGRNKQLKRLFGYILGMMHLAIFTHPTPLVSEGSQNEDAYTRPRHSNQNWRRRIRIRIREQSGGSKLSKPLAPDSPSRTLGAGTAIVGQDTDERGPTSSCPVSAPVGVYDAAIN